MMINQKLFILQVGVNVNKNILKIANKNLKSRLIVGTGKYKNFLETAKAVKASGANMVTVAIRRVNIIDKKKPMLTDYLDPKKIIFLPNTAGCFNSKEALRTLRLAREMGGWKLVKLEVLGDKKIAIEYNGAIIPKTSFKKKYLKNNDKLEIVHFIGGG